MKLRRKKQKKVIEPVREVLTKSEEREKKEAIR